MFPIFNILAALPWRFIGASVLAVVLFAGGCQFGTIRVTAKWDAEKVATAVAVAKQAEHVAAVTVQQSTINQEISDEFNKTKVRLAADRQRLLARVPGGVRFKPASSYGAMPAIPDVAAGVDAAAADAVSAAACEKLAEDAAQTTLMVVEFQRWYREHAGAWSSNSD